ncbi:flavodoxin [Clostridium pasteurianum]|uniref:flavodoxin n=1 Tax=Clostridium pasteurianum TaxID=1501 RepID=UPI0022608424|nr:flavodoxin [Clostridium pasteurianum]UZW15161.1 flavodoxin [Clostridium pasteurianum]
MGKVYIINGSPKIKKDNNSQYFIDEFLKLLEDTNLQMEQTIISRGYYEDIYPKLMESDIIIFTAPLYVDSIPSHLLSFMIGLERYIKQSRASEDISTKVYAIFNCGFFEGYQNRIALDIMRNFCHKVGFTWRFGIGIGAGEFMGPSKNIPLKSKVKEDTFNALLELKKDIVNNSLDIKNNIYTSPKMPRFIFQLAGNIGWIKQAKSNRVSIRGIYAKPYVKKL